MIHYYERWQLTPCRQYYVTAAVQLCTQLHHYLRREIFVFTQLLW
jgi:hypothetical protein